MFWRDKAGCGWYWENPKTSVSTDCSAALAILRRVSMSAAENGCSLGRAVFPVQRADTEDAGKGLAISEALCRHAA
jgi:hypothetical protein